MDYVALTQKFFEDHPHSEYPQFLYKVDRPYILLRVRIAGQEYAIPFRSHIKKTKNTNALKTRDGDIVGEFYGVDYTKSVIITDKDYYSYDIRGKRVKVNDEDHQVILKNKSRIKKEMEAYIEKYKKNFHKKHVQRNRLFYEYSTLQYYHSELGIVEETDSSQAEK